MSPAQHRLLVLWAGLLVAVVCLAFLPGSRLLSVLVLLAAWAGIALVGFLTRPRPSGEPDIALSGLPEACWRHPVMLVCGDLPRGWPDAQPVIVCAGGCWIRVAESEQLMRTVQHLLWLRPQWGRQLAVIVSIRPQRHTDTGALTTMLLGLRWQITQLRRKTRYAFPLLLNGLVGSRMMKDALWQSAMPGENLSVWRASSAPSSIAAWVTTGGAMAVEQQVMMNSLMDWFRQHVKTIFIEEGPDLPPVKPAAVLWGLMPGLPGALPSSLWSRWLSQHTALNQVEDWLPVQEAQDDALLFPEFILPLLPEGAGLTPRQRTGRYALGMFTLAAGTALLCSAWNNHRLIQRVSFDIAHYYQTSVDEAARKAGAVAVLREDARQLDGWARSGEPLRMGLGLYHGGRLHLPVLEAIRTYRPLPTPVQPSAPVPDAPQTVRLNSMALFDTGQSALKPGATKLLVSALVGIKARPGWLIVVSGHTDSTGSPPVNQALSLRRAEAVRDWMRDTGDVPGSCFAVQGYGAGRPAATNDTPEGRAQNRRVEISLVPQADACRAPGEPPAPSKDDGASHLRGE
ncbi:hypothetical protein LG71_15820 [Pluralibacter gergoviae]|uniref:OmpA family protein n=4 Tax=Pluralibacter gergoviae TaxID=61647 RepID=UPI0004F8F35A|nr:OmpA family protein [Pluralibacter gergoviae]AIR01271.1 hypothetical protein LG71_15820 [Pluralibacter gergoviae]